MPQGRISINTNSGIESSKLTTLEALANFFWKQSKPHLPDYPLRGADDEQIRSMDQDALLPGLRKLSFIGTQL